MSITVLITLTRPSIVALSRSTSTFSVALLVLALCLGCERGGPDAGRADRDRPATSEDLEIARRLIATRNLIQADQVLEQYLRQFPDDSVALEMHGDVAAQLADLPAAVKRYRSAAAATDTPGKNLWLKWADANIQASRPFDAIDVLQDAVKGHPNAVEIRQNLASMLAQVGLQNEANEHFQWLVRRRHAGQGILLMLSDLTRPQTTEATCRSALERNPDDLRPLFSLALPDVLNSKWQKVADALKPVVEKHGDFLPATALYGRALVELNQTDAVQQWSQTLPPEIESYSQYWLAAGTWASRHGSTDQAARAYWSAVKLNEDDPEALNGLSTALAKLARTEESAIAARRAKKIGALRSHIETLGNWRFNSQKSVVDLALTLKDLGRPWEAANWLLFAASMEQHRDARLKSAYNSIRNGLSETTPWQLPDQKVSTKIDVSMYPEIAWHAFEDEAAPQIHPQSNAPLRFANEAKSRSLVHLCDIGKTDDTLSGLMIYQSGAGAIGVIDFDLDGWPDTYLTVMDGTPNREDSYPNRLYRNHQGQFSDVTDASSLGDRGYAQGICVGDYNGDGWPDVYVANIGENRLYRNNGDGTFRDVTKQCKLGGTGWTTSVAIADLNEDGHADIYEVGYCSGEKPLTQECMEQSIGQPRSCSPMAFAAQPDRIWSGNQDGTFSEKSSWLAEHEGGRGFALVIGDLDRQGGLETFVANDMTANHYWAKSVDATPFQLSEQASIRGLAFNRRSEAQASMGIAAADADNDGDIDFLLTHFSNDHNTFYKQFSPGAWSDESQVAGFEESSRRMLAYGTQWIDVDNDGSLEVFIANGDIDDFSFAGRLFRQPAQLLAQAERGRWEVVQADRLGNYFTRDHLARAVATLDADHDGLSDIVVTHLAEPVALLINRSETQARQSRFFLQARSTHRDAIGARVRFSCNDQLFEQQRIAGNGFQCSNEACLVFGISAANKLENVEVVWPDGHLETIGDLPAGMDHLIVEDQGASRLDR